MKRYTHYSIVSAQRTPTLAPLLSSSFPAREVVLVVTPQQENQQGFLNLEILLKAKCPVRRLRVNDAFGTEEIERKLDKDFRQISHDANPLLNATGGTKPLSTGAFLSCYNYDVPVYYVNVDQLHWLYCPNGREAELPQTALDAKLNIKQLLAIHGVEEESRQQQTPIQRNLTDLLDRWCERAADNAMNNVFGELNWVASQAERTLTAIVDSQPSAELSILLEEMEDENLITQRGNEVIFADESSRFFCNGGWLEQAGYRALQHIKKHEPELGIQDVACSLQTDIRLEEDGRIDAHQEIDIAVLKNNRLYLVECKTAALSRPDASGQQTKAERAIFKLAAIQKKLGGSATSGMLLSYRPVRAEDKKRAQILEIEVLDAGKLTDLRDRLCQWLRNK